MVREREVHGFFVPVLREEQADSGSDDSDSEVEEFLDYHEIQKVSKEGSVVKGGLRSQRIGKFTQQFSFIIAQR